MQTATMTSVIAAAMNKGLDMTATMTSLHKAGFRKVNRASVYALRSQVRQGTFGRASVKATLAKVSPAAAQMLHGFKVASIMNNAPLKSKENRARYSAAMNAFIKSINKAERMKVAATKTLIKAVVKTINK